MQFHKASLETINDGKAINQFNYELKKAIENCQDVNTETGFVRVVTLKVRIKPTDDRQRAAVTFQAESKLAPDAAGTDQMIFSKEGAFISSARQLHFEDVTEIDGEDEKEGSND